MRKLGWTSPEAAVGETVAVGGGKSRTVVGVLDDFHTQSLHNPIRPVVVAPAPNVQYIALKLAPGVVGLLIERVRASWSEVAPAYPFDFFFLDRAFDQLYRTEQRVAQVFTLFFGLALFIAALGLFGLAAYAVERRTKEIGIRKALGATVGSVLRLLSTDILKLVAVAVVLATPVAVWAARRWLQEFAYHVDLSAGVFVAAAAGILLVAFLAVSTQVPRAARTDPARVLRSD